ncbi:MAG: M23 family metallopeptidase, partial [Bacteroidota bacterium]
CCLQACSSAKVPQQKLRQVDINASHISRKIQNDSFIMTIQNPLSCPLTFYIKDDDSGLSSQLNNIVVQAKSSTTVKTPYTKSTVPQLGVMFGDVNKTVQYEPLSLPIRPNEKRRIIQGYNSSYSHNTDASRYAIDFTFQNHDTIFSAMNGYVVGFIDGYKHGGKGKKWKGYDNYITIYDPNTGLFTQYAHLRHKGVLVEKDQLVKMGDPIGLSGLTGFTDVEHLHFNVLVPDEATRTLKSAPIEFLEGYKGEDLKRGDWVIKQ